MWLTLIFCATAAAFLFTALAALFHQRWVQPLPSQEAPAIVKTTSAQSPRCSVVIAARDEETRIEGTVRRLLAQRGIEVELLVVDDRSADRTSEILHQLAKDDARVKIQRIDVLPDGWLGKCHACHVGARAATGEWILFTDADCWIQPDVIARAVRVAEREQADHVSITPGLDLKTIPTRAWHILFLMSISHWFSGPNRDRPNSHIGSGAFNLVRTAAYRECGGYEALRLTVLDDVKLGQLMVRSGKRTRAFIGVDDVACHWGTTVWSMVKLAEKNSFAAADFQIGLPIFLSLGVTIAAIVIVLGLMSGAVAGLIAALSPLTFIVPASILTRRVGWSWPCAVFVPLMIPVFVYAMVNSTWATLRNGGVRWRDTFYPLETLRAGTVR